MEIFVAGVDIIKTITTLIGGGMVIVGGIQFFQGYSENNASQKAVGIGTFIGGAGIAFIGLTLVPMLANLK